MCQSPFFYLPEFIFLVLLVSENSAIFLQQVFLLWKGLGFLSEHYLNRKVQEVKTHLLYLWLGDTQDWSHIALPARDIQIVHWVIPSLHLDTEQGGRGQNKTGEV